MSRKKTRRKHYPLVNTIELATKRVQPINGQDLANLRTVNKDAVDAFFAGRATPNDWRTVADMHNIAKTMAEGGVGPEVLLACALVDAALCDSFERHRRTGRLGMTGPQLVALRELYEYYDLQTQSIDRSVLERWIKKTADRIRSAHPDVKVFI